MNTSTPSQGLSPAVYYALGLLAEEFGEGLQLIGKALRFGLDTPGVKDPLTGVVDMDKTPRSLMPKEFGDAIAAIDFAAALGLFDRQEVSQRAVEKFNRLTDPDARDNLGRPLAPALSAPSAPRETSAEEVGALVERLRDGLSYFKDGSFERLTVTAAAAALSSLSRQLEEARAACNSAEAMAMGYASDLAALQSPRPALRVEEVAFLLCSQDRGKGVAEAVRRNNAGAWAQWKERAAEVVALFQPAPQQQEPLLHSHFQARVHDWMMACFGEAISQDRVERGDRLLEEVLEVLQSGGYDPARVPALVEYVYGRPVGEPAQEVGGVMVCVAAYCHAFGLDMHEAGEAELARVWTKIEQIREKQRRKAETIPFSPLPQQQERG